MTASGALSPGLWTADATRLRRMESALLDLWAGEGYAEVVPPLLLPEAPVRAASPEALASRTLRLDANGEGPLALRADFTAGVALMAARRLERLGGPQRLCYAGTVVRRPAADRPEGVETFQAGCERLSPENGPEGDEEVALLAAGSLTALGLGEVVLELGHWGIVGPLMESLPWPETARAELEQALNRKSRPALESLVRRYGECPEAWLLVRLLHLGGRSEAVESLAADLDGAGVLGAWRELRALAAALGKAFPGLPVRLDPTDVRHWSYYTGLTLKAFSRRHPFALLSGGRYDSLYPALGRPFGACGFALHLDRLLEVERGLSAGPGTEGGF